MLQKLADTGLLGWQATGDLGGHTVYTSERGKLVVFPRSPPLNPPTPAQEECRDRFRRVAEWWRDCPTAYREGVQHMARACGLYVTGFNVCVCVALCGRRADWETLCRQSGLDMECPPDLRNP